jgi:hypothetical protein
MSTTVEFLEELADRLDRWARESREHGYSTHQVQANIDAANECRRQASAARRSDRHSSMLQDATSNFLTVMKPAVVHLVEGRLPDGVAHLEKALAKFQVDIEAAKKERP